MTGGRRVAPSVERSAGVRYARPRFGLFRLPSVPSLPPVRTFSAALALVLLACADSDRGDLATRDGDAGRTPAGPDPVVLRVTRGGGPATAYVYPQLDSVVWQSGANVPALDRILAFDADGGSLAYVDRMGMPGRLDLRLGSVTRASRDRLSALASADGDAIYGITPQGTVVRLTSAGEAWRLTPPAAARDVLPQPDGWLLVVADRGDETVMWRLRPPEQRLVDTVSLPRVSRLVRTRVGDRVYLASDARLLGVRTQGLEPVPGAEFDAPVRALATTPSGDRIFVTTDSSDEVAVFDRYAEDVAESIELPGIVRDLRVDPLGRLLLVRPAAGDSAWVVSISTGEVIGGVRTAWRADLPFVAPDGAIATVRGDDVVFVDRERLAPVRTVRGGADDFWYTFAWSGFRPRADGIDDPVEFRRARPEPAAQPADSIAPTSDSGAPPRDTVAPVLVPRPTPERPPVPPRAEPAPAATGFLVSFAALLNADRARELAAQIQVDGQRARVLSGEQNGVPIFRVVIGPIATRAEADRIGRASGRTYFIIEGAP